RPHLEGLLVSTSFPFGIIKKSLLFIDGAEVIIRPVPIHPPPGLVSSVLRSGDRGLTPARRAGSGDEFFSLRDHQPRDGLPAIAWRASARRGELLVRQTAAPAPMKLTVILSLPTDIGARGGPTEADAERAISLAAGAVDEAMRRGLAVGLAIPRAGIDIRA